MKNINLTTNEMAKLIKTTDLLGKVNVLIAKMENPFLLTYILESIDTLSSNEVENIHSTYDGAADDIIINNDMSPYVRYRETLKQSHQRLIASEIIRPKDIVWINTNIRAIKSGFRKTPVEIKNNKGVVIHKGASADQIPTLISELTNDINEDRDMNLIIKALLIHHKFENIHPFTDGNGRTGRILFALLLSKYQILDIPASVFSYSVLKNKNKYYKALNQADQGDFHFYISEMLDILNESLEITIEFAKKLDEKLKAILSFDKVKDNKNLQAVLKKSFVGVKTTAKYISRKLDMNQKTVKKYLDVLVDLNILKQEVKGKYKPYKNLVLEKLINDYFTKTK